MPAQPDRILPLEGAFNFRDLGGYPTAEGRTVRWHSLYRADAVHRLPDEELDLLAARGVRTVIDLRTADEVAMGHLHDEPRGFQHVHLDVLGTRWQPDDLPDDADAGLVLGELYIAMLTLGPHAFRGALEILADPDRVPAVFHCAAGKDRTGVLAAMVLSLLGVDDDIIIADYAISGTNMDRLIERLARDRPEALTTMNDQPSAYLAAPPAAMERLLAHVHATYGSWNGYVREIGVSDDVVDALRASFLI